MSEREKYLLHLVGHYMGDEIYNKSLPTMDSDGYMYGLRVKNRYEPMVNTTYGETKEYKRLSDIWFKKTNDGTGESKKEWQEKLRYRYYLKEKYLPHNLTCYLGKVNLGSEEELEIIKKGLIVSLWNCDVCEYSLKKENIEIFNDKYFTVVKLKLDLNIPDNG